MEEILIDPDIYYFNSINDIQKIFNSLHNRLRFIMKVDVNGKLSFLDIMIIIRKSKNYIERIPKKIF